MSMTLTPSSGPMVSFAPCTAQHSGRSNISPSNVRPKARSRLPVVWAYAPGAVIVREGGRSSIPEARILLKDSGILDAPPSRGMTDSISSATEKRALLFFPHHLPQFGLQHLAVIVLRQRVEIDVALRPLEAGDRGEAMRVELAIVCRSTLFKHHAGHHDLTPVQIRHADRGRLAHIRMRQQRL